MTVSQTNRLGNFINLLLMIMTRVQEQNCLNISGGYFNKERISDAEIVYVKGNVGPKMCVEDCMLLSTCNAVNYFRSELKCEFLNGFFETNLIQSNKGSSYTEIRHWHRNKGPCYPNPCQNFSEKRMCIENNQEKHICISIDAPCDSNPCKNNGQCRNDIDDYSCTCPTGYYGKNCQYTPCSSITCRNSGTCEITGSTWDCICPSGFYGSFCQNTPCTEITCQNSGNCIITGSTWDCSCPSGFYGTYCQYTPCTNIDCQNSGTCEVSGSTFKCQCLSGYSGTYCQYDPCYGVSSPNGGSCRVSGSRCKCCWDSFWNSETCEYY